MQNNKNNKNEDNFRKIMEHFLGDKGEWTRLATKLFLGKLHMKIESIWKKYDYKRGKSTNALMYWEIGNVIYEFLGEKKNGNNRNAVKITLPHESLAEILEDIEPNSAQKNNSSENAQIVWKKRSFEACYYFFQVIPDKSKIDDKVPWSIYQEIASERGKLDKRKKNEVNNIISTIIDFRNQYGSKFFDKIVRDGLDNILDYDRSINKSFCQDEFNKILQSVNSE